MFKTIILSALYNLSDDQVEHQIRDRLSFMRFLGLGLEDRVPDAKTVWLYREQLTQAGVIEALFETFDGHLKDQGYLAMGGQIIAPILPRRSATAGSSHDRVHRRSPRGARGRADLQGAADRPVDLLRPGAHRHRGKRRSIRKAARRSTNSTTKPS